MTPGDTAARWLERIAAASLEGPGVTRLPWTAEHRAALDQIAGWMREAGLEVSLDAAGTLCGASPNPSGKPVLLIGSHQDSVPSGGAFDGIMGIALGCLAAKALRDRLTDMPFALEVVAFADEEGVRFPTALIGPRAMAGTLEPGALDMRDRDGVSMREAMTAFGLDTGSTLSIRRDTDRIVGYFEVHIEQGPVLEARDLPVAAVSAICGISRHGFRITGETGHAGTVPMAGRRDALVAASRIIAAVSDAGGKIADLRTTVGQIAVSPGAVNAIPSQVRFPLEIRAPDDAVRVAFEDAAKSLASDICRRANVELDAARTYAQPAAVCDSGMTDALLRAMAVHGHAKLAMASGATHDASAMADLCPISMLFVRCRGGLSHRPDEFASSGDMDVGVKVLAEAIGLLAEEPL